MRRVLSLFSAAFVALGSAHAAIVSLDAFDPNNGEEVVLDAGTYEISFVADQYTAWNAWGRNTGCDSQGENCSRGWLTNVSLASDSLGTIKFGRHGRFETAAQALAAALPLTITLTQRESVRFFISDNPYSDNKGGVSLQIAAAEVPLPASGVLLLSAVAAAAVKRRKARQAR